MGLRQGDDTKISDFENQKGCNCHLLKGGGSYRGAAVGRGWGGVSPETC